MGIGEPRLIVAYLKRGYDYWLRGFKTVCMFYYELSRDGWLAAEESVLVFVLHDCDAMKY